MACMTRTALITGASRGLGLALCDRLARHGWRLLITARNPAMLEQARERLAGWTEVVALPGDVSDPLHRQALSLAAAELGGLDLLVNNAAILGPSPRPPLLDLEPDDLTGLFQVNVLAPMALIQALRHHLPPGATIVNVSSDAAPTSFPGWGGYGMTKAALDHLSGTLAAENLDWRIYWVDPGDMLTDMYRASFPDAELHLPPPEANVPAFMRLIEGDYPSGRYQALELLS